jgi:hypothetical protein
MTFRVPYIPAKQTFYQLNGLDGASDFTLARKLRVYQCCSKPCGNNNIDPDYLYVNLIKKMDLNGVDVVQTLFPITGPVTPTTINPDVPFYLTYSIDPNGSLFGDTPCGINNYPHFMVYK